MIATLCGLIALAQSSDVSQKELPNGAKYRVERVAGSEQVMVALFASAASLPDDGGTPGTRHLLEHFIAKGSDRLLDVKLESVGLSLTATTDRDGMCFVIMGPSEQAVAAVSSLSELFQPLNVSQDDIANELKIIDQEGVFRDRFARFFDSAWLTLFSPGVDSVHGNLPAMAQLKPEELKSYAQVAMSSGGISVFVRGDVDPGVTGMRLGEILAGAPAGDSLPSVRNILESIGRKESVKATGSARAVVAAGLDRPMTLARLGAALALMRLEPGLTVIYEASFDRGPVMMYGTDGDSLESISKYSKEDMYKFAPLARLNAVLYVRGLEREGPEYGVLRAKQLRQAPAYDLARLGSTAMGLTDEEIWSALQDWQGGALHIGGTE